MYSTDEYNALVSKYGLLSSWAVWDYKIESDLSIIDTNTNILNSKNVFLGLNISSSLKNIPWCNFHGGKHDRKLKYACNDTILRGSYITDLFKDIPEVQSAKIEKHITPEIVAKNIGFFDQEMSDVKANSNSKFIVLGKKAEFYYKEYFDQKITNNVLYYPHYSSTRDTDKKWVLGLWKELGIHEDFDLIFNKYKK